MNEPIADTWYEGDGRLYKARMLESQAQILRKEVTRDKLLKTEGPMSDAYRKSNEELSRKRAEWDLLYGGAFFNREIIAKF